MSTYPARPGVLRSGVLPSCTHLRWTEPLRSPRRRHSRHPRPKTVPSPQTGRPYPQRHTGGDPRSFPPLTSVLSPSRSYGSCRVAGGLHCPTPSGPSSAGSGVTSPACRGNTGRQCVRTRHRDWSFLGTVAVWSGSGWGPDSHFTPPDVLSSSGTGLRSPSTLRERYPSPTGRGL